MAAHGGAILVPGSAGADRAPVLQSRWLATASGRRPVSAPFELPWTLAEAIQALAARLIRSTARARFCVVLR